MECGAEPLVAALGLGSEEFRPSLFALRALLVACALRGAV